MALLQNMMALLQKRDEVNMHKLSKILKTLMADEGLTETELFRRTGIGQPVIHRIASGETDNPKIATLSPIASYFSISISQLIGDDPLPQARLTGRYSRKLERWHKVPLLSWTQIPMWLSSTNPQSPARTVATDANVSDKAYAVQLYNTSMNPQFTPGTTLIIDPLRDPKDGDFAIVHQIGQQSPTFKQVLIDGATIILKPLNKDFKTINHSENYRFLGVLVQSKFDTNPLKYEVVQAKPSATLSTPTPVATQTDKKVTEAEWV